MKPRPDSLKSTTVKVDSPAGSCFVTVGIDEEGEPFEVFVNVGRAGSEMAAHAEAIGRLCSLALRLTNETPEERMRGIIKQLLDIGGARTAGPDGSVSSMPDAVAQGLARERGWWEE